MLTPDSVELQDIPDLAWSMLRDGAARGRAPFHTPVLATQGAAGPSARTVVLRAADPRTRTVLCHTDERSPKVDELRNQGFVAWVFYDPAQKVQLRLRGTATLHHDDDVALARWSASRAGSRLCYQNPLAPGAVVDRPESALPDDAAVGYRNFTAIRCVVQELDWLYLSARGHRRARFAWRDEGWQGSWIAP